MVAETALRTLFKFILLTAIRSKLYWGLFLVLGCVFGFSKLVGFLALSEGEQMQLVYFAFLSRLIIVCGTMLFVCFNIDKSIENKELEFILARPISRSVFILSYWSGFVLVATILLIPVAVIVALYNKSNLFSLLLWNVSVILELQMILTFAITTSLVLKGGAVNCVLATSLFYFISRMMGFFVYSIDMPNTITNMRAILKILSSFFPRLDLFGKTEWLLYGVNNMQDVYVILLQSLIYIPLMLLIAFHDFY